MRLCSSSWWLLLSSKLIKTIRDGTQQHENSYFTATADAVKKKCKTPRKFSLVKSQINSLAGKLHTFYSRGLHNHAKLLMLNHKSRNEVRLLYKSGGEVIIRFVFKDPGGYLYSLMTDTGKKIWLCICKHTYSKSTQTGRYWGGGGGAIIYNVIQIAKMIDDNQH